MRGLVDKTMNYVLESVCRRRFLGVAGGGGGGGACPLHKFPVPTQKILLNVKQMDKEQISSFLVPPPPHSLLRHGDVLPSGMAFQCQLESLEKDFKLSFIVAHDYSFHALLAEANSRKF